METKLYVGNLPFSATEEELRALFEKAGTVVSADIVKDRETGKSRGFAFVQMGSQAEAEKAVSMLNGYSLGGRQLRVNPAQARPDSGRGGFGGPRGGGGGGGYERKPGGFDRNRGGGSNGPRRY